MAIVEGISRTRNVKHLIPKILHSGAVVQWYFDPHMHKSMASDHLLSEMFKFLSEICFLKLKEVQESFRFETFLGLKMREAELSTHNLSNHKMKTSNSFSVSISYRLNTLISVALTSLLPDTKIEDYSLLSNFAQLWGLMFWWRQKCMEWNHAVWYVDGFRTQKYFNDLQKLAKEYITLVGQICQKGMHFWRLLDRPDTYRILALYIHTPPSFTRGPFLSYLAFEANHQTLNSSISKQIGSLKKTHQRSSQSDYKILISYNIQKGSIGLCDDDHLREHAMQNINDCCLVKLWLIIPNIFWGWLIWLRTNLTGCLKT